MAETTAQFSDREIGSAGLVELEKLSKSITAISLQRQFESSKEWEFRAIRYGYLLRLCDVWPCWEDFQEKEDIWKRAVKIAEKENFGVPQFILVNEWTKQRRLDYFLIMASFF